tara:strand:+ start:429 stop:725 length:297 start_codon:yes stop_codon:yes gene_type:complete
MKKAKSIFKKIKSISENGIEPVFEGLNNYKANLPHIEKKAIIRAQKCLNCNERLYEPVEIVRVKDKRIESNSNHVCGVCFCSLTYLTRQDQKICEKWE